MTTRDKILLSFAQFHFLTVEQVCSLHFSRQSESYVNNLLKQLVGEKYLQRYQQNANTKYVYSLARRGVNFLREHKGGVSFVPSEHKRHDNLFMDHWLSTTDFLIAALKLPTVSTAEIVEVCHDLTLKSRLKPSKVVPDGWLDIRYGSVQTCLWLELDRGTEEQKNVRAKVKAIVEWCNMYYVETFNTRSLNILFATTSGGRRADQLQLWIGKELEGRDEAGWFLFTALPLGQLDPMHIFFTSIWKRIGVEGLVSLL